MKMRTFYFLFSLLILYLCITGYRAYLYDKQNKFRYNYRNPSDSQYYISFNYPLSEWPTDTNGIYMIDYGASTNRFLAGLQYNPANVSIAALILWDDYLADKDSLIWQSFFKQADWLCSAYHKNGALKGAIPYNFDYLELKSPWVSSLAQGLALSVLSRAYIATYRPEYLKAMHDIFLPFTRSVEDGGVVSPFCGLFFEEFPAESNKHILNGFLYSILGVFDYWTTSGNTDAKLYLDSALVTLDRVLPKYDTGFWSLYSLPDHSNLGNHFRLSSPSYHVLHADLLNAVFDISNNSTCKDYAERFRKHYEEGYFKWIVIYSYILFKDVMFILKTVN